MIKLFTILAIVAVLFAGPAWAFEPAWNIPVERSTLKSVIVWDYSTGKYVTLENTPDWPNVEIVPPVNPCRWGYISVPEDKVKKMKRDGWTSFALIEDGVPAYFIEYKKVKYIYLKKWICQEEK